jgi:hypothetical protein
MARFRTGAPVFELSLCYTSLTSDLPPAAVHQVFSTHKVSAQSFAQHGRRLVKEGELAVRLGTRVYQYSAVAPFLAATVAFGLEDAQKLSDLLPDEWFEVAVPKVCHLGCCIRACSCCSCLCP